MTTTDGVPLGGVFTSPFRVVSKIVRAPKGGDEGASGVKRKAAAAHNARADKRTRRGSDTEDDAASDTEDDSEDSVLAALARLHDMVVVVSMQQVALARLVADATSSGGAAVEKSEASK